MLITCPSGLSGTIRKMSAKEGKLVADRRSTKGTFLADEILKGCFVSIADSGPYSFAINSTPDWARCIAADRTYALIQIRALSLGANFEFKVQCDAEGCRKTYAWELDLNSLPIKVLSQEARQLLQAGNKMPIYVGRETRRGNPTLNEPSEVVIAEGTRAECKLTTGYDQNKWAPQLQESNDRMLLSLRMRLVSVDGVHENDLLRWLEALDYDVLLRMRDAMDDWDGGIDTDISVICPKCGNEQETTLPFDRDFFFPKRMKRS